MGVVVTFDYAAWIAQFPDLASVTQPQADGFFAAASITWPNDGSGPVTVAATQTQILNYLTAHYAALFGPTAAATLVGRITSASEGSVSVSAEWPGANANSAWFLQTKYGAAYWQMTAIFRTMHYRPGIRRSWPYRPYVR